MGRDTDTPTPQKRISFSYTKMSAIPTFTIKIEKKKLWDPKFPKHSILKIKVIVYKNHCPMLSLLRIRSPTDAYPYSV